MRELFRSVFATPRDLILIVAAGWVGLALADKRAKQTTMGEQAIDSLAFAMVLAFVIGGRLLYAAGHLSAFVGSPASIVSLNVGLFDIWGGLASAAIVAAVVMQRRHLPTWQTLDLLAPFLAALNIGLALSHVATGAAFGKETNVPWAIDLWGAQRHPTQVYELIAGLAILGVVWYYGAPRKLSGKTFLLWLALTAGARLVIEGFRGDSTLVFGGLRLAQIVAWVVLATALVGLELIQRSAATEVPAAEGPEAPDEARVEPAPTGKRQRAAPGKNSAP